MDYDAEEYYRHYILEHLRHLELAANSGLVELLRDGRPRVTIKSLREKYGSGKRVIVRETLREPDLLRQYRTDRAQITPAMSHAELATSGGTPLPDWTALCDALTPIPTGREHATSYERAVEQLLSAMFYPSLTNPIVQHQIHEGRKRIDITYTNIAAIGFFYWLGAHYSAAQLFVECKNYGHEIANPELDQLSGRFSPSRGQVGFLVCRAFSDKELFMKRCIDTAHDERGFVIPLDDQDLIDLVEACRNPDPIAASAFVSINQRFLRLINE
jgi:hypothetical protein